MKNIKYIGNFTDGSDWAKAATYNALALSQFCNVQCVEKKYNPNINYLFDDKLEELKNNQLNNYDVVVHHVLPQDYIREANSYNVGFLDLDSSLSSPLWIKKIKLMDSMITSSDFSYSRLREIRISWIDKVCNFFDYEKTSNNNAKFGIKNMENAFNFIYFGSMGPDLELVVKSFHMTFSHLDNVNLVIVTSDDMNAVVNYCNNVKANMKISSRYKTEIVVSGFMNHNNLCGLLNDAHMSIICSSLSGWNYAAVEGLARGVPTISVSNTPSYYHTKGDYTTQIGGHDERCYALGGFNDIRTYKDTYTSCYPDELSKALLSAVRIYFDNRERYNQISEDGKTTVSQYDYRNGKSKYENIHWL